MCGRYTISETVSNLKAKFCFKNSLNLQPRFNLAPAQAAPVVRTVDEGSRHISMLNWGFASKNLRIKGTADKRIINARSETLLEKKSFKEIAISQRCLVVADGFYEWKNEFGSKQAFYIYKDDQTPFAFAGLWRTEPGCGHLSPQNKSYVIVTRRAVSSINHIHHRMPFILEEEHYETWLKGSVADADSLLNEGYDIELASHQVSDRVGSIKNDDPNLCDKYTPPQLTLF